MVVIIHQYITMNQDSIAIIIVLKYFKQLFSIPILKEYLLSLVPPTGNLIQTPSVLYP
jgi:hypothetical protein